jgi:hypothetical protein
MNASPQGLSESEMDFEEKPVMKSKTTSKKSSGDFSDDDNPYAMFEEMIQPKPPKP